MKMDFKVISPGLYDNTCQCLHCDFKFSQSLDASFEENEQRTKHRCEDHGRRYPTELQKLARKDNWTIFRLKGSQGIANNLAGLHSRLSGDVTNDYVKALQIEIDKIRAKYHG